MQFLLVLKQILFWGLNKHTCLFIACLVSLWMKWPSPCCWATTHIIWNDEWASLFSSMNRYFNFLAFCVGRDLRKFPFHAFILWINKLGYQGIKWLVKISGLKHFVCLNTLRLNDRDLILSVFNITWQTLNLLMYSVSCAFICHLMIK